MAALAGIGAAAGYYWAGPTAASRATTDSAAGRPNVPPHSVHSPLASPAISRDASNRSLTAQPCRFRLSEADIKDTQQAPDIAVDGKGRLHLIWASVTGDVQTCFRTSSPAGLDGFSDPQVVVESPIAFRSRENGKKGYPIRMAPHVVARGDTIWLTWSEKVPDEPTVRMVCVHSIDNGETCSEAVCVHVHPQARPTFTALAIGQQGELACSWLDGRESTQNPCASVRPAGKGEFLPEFQLPGSETGKGVCPCCPTCATFAPDGTLFVAFRNLLDGYRDPVVVRLLPGARQFDGPFVVVSPTWKFDGCPHDGPSLVVANGKLHATWMDAHTGVQRVYYGWAGLGDLQFHVAPLHAAGPGTQGNPKLYADVRGCVHAVWEQSLDNETPPVETIGHQHGPPRTGSGRGICYASAAEGAEVFESVRLVCPVSGAFQTRPAITGSDDGQIYLAWCELSETGKAIVVTSLAGDHVSEPARRASR